MVTLHPFLQGIYKPRVIIFIFKLEQLELYGVYMVPIQDFYHCSSLKIKNYQPGLYVLYKIKRRCMWKRLRKGRDYAVKLIQVNINEDGVLILYPSYVWGIFTISSHLNSITVQNAKIQVKIFKYICLQGGGIGDFSIVQVGSRIGVT